MPALYPAGMRVVLDATVVTPRQKGAGRVVHNLVAALPAAAPEHEFVALAFPEGMPLLSATAKNLLVKRVAAHRNVVWELRELARQATLERADAAFVEVLEKIA